MQSTPVNPYAEKTDDPAKLSSEAIEVAYADVTVILDGSGSMSSMKAAVIEGFNAYVGKMRGTPGDTKWTMVQFDDHESARGAKEDFPRVVFEGKGEQEVPFLTHESFTPRGWTALRDAACLTIDRIAARTSGREDRVQPVVVIITDGYENASKEFSDAQLRQRIEETSRRGWQYIYLGANQDAFAVGEGYKMDTRCYGSGGGFSHSAGGGQMSYSPTLSGGLAADANVCNNFAPTHEGMLQAIGSGLVGAAAVTSGAVARGKLVTQQPIS